MNKRGTTFEKNFQAVSQPDAQNGPTFALYLLGTVQLYLPTGNLLQTNYWANDRQLALFIYLVLNRDHVTTPTEINHQFWPYLPVAEVDEEVAIICQTLSRLLQLPNPIVRQRDGYQLQTNISCWLDSEQFDELITQSEEASDQLKKMLMLQQAIALYRNDFLFNVPFKQKWIAIWRAHFQQRYLVALQTLSALWEQSRDKEEAQNICLNLLKPGSFLKEDGRSDPNFIETPNSPNQTLHHCKRLIALLQKELELLQEDSEPSTETANAAANLPKKETRG
jgi:two-component SAPR family response regulator